MYFSPSLLHELYQPSSCKKRVWLKANHPELAADDSDFMNLLIARGTILEKAHLSNFDKWYSPQYLDGNLIDGFNATMELIRNNAPVIYQGVFIDEDLLGIPDFLILDQDGKYNLRESKLAIDLPAHPEISLQLGIYRIVAKNVLGYEPVLEVLCGDGQIKSDLTIPNDDEVFFTIGMYRSLQTDTEPEEPVGWSKCQQCVFWRYCWNRAIERKCIATVPSVDQGAAKKFWEMGILNYEGLHNFPEELLPEIKRPWGGGEQRIGANRAKKIKREVHSLISNQILVVSKPPLPMDYDPGKRPVMMFDIENDIFDPELGVKVYLWGCLLITDDGIQEPKLILADKGTDGDSSGWFEFLAYTDMIFNKYGDIPFVHYSPHEKTWVKKYIERYGDPQMKADRLLKNLWDMHPAISQNIILPSHSYGLKSVEKFAGFSRSQEEFGGLWSIIMYDRYLNATTQDDADLIIKEIKDYNYEDILASYRVYEWLESMAQ